MLFFFIIIIYIFLKHLKINESKKNHKIKFKSKVNKIKSEFVNNINRSRMTDLESARKQ